VAASPEMKLDKISPEYNLDQKYREPIDRNKHPEINQINQDSHHLPDDGDYAETSAIILTRINIKN